MKPEAGQEWLTKAGRILVIGKRRQRQIQAEYVVENEDGIMWTEFEPAFAQWQQLMPEPPRTEQPQPAEDPDEWVIQDRVPIRDGIDQGRYQQKETRPAPDAVWYALADMNMKTRGLTHGATHPYDQNCMLFVRCRRRDLPSNADWSYHNQQKPQPKKRMLRLWVDSDCNVHAGLKGDRDLELHYDHETRQFYTEETR